MIDSLRQLDHDFFFLVNGNHNSFFDFIFWWASDRFIWIPLYLFLLYKIVRDMKNLTLTISFFVTIALIILTSDQLSVLLFKNIFHRYRPCHNAAMAAAVHLLGDCGGKFGFVSSHAANVSALSVFLILSFGKKMSWMKWVMIPWAVLVCYSRVYSGAHFPGDVFFGAALGAAIAALYSFLFLFISKNYGQGNNPN